MVAGLKFLSKKGFNPQNLSNQKRVWEREQAAANEERQRKEREAQLRRERDDEELARARGDTPKLNFLYEPPPGLEGSSDGKRSAEKQPSSSETSSAAPSADLATRQPGDDDAAAAFRAMLAGGAAPEEGTAAETEDTKPSAAVVRGTMPGAFGTVLQGSSYDQTAPKGEDKKPSDGPLSNLEKAVGRRAAGGGALTLEEQIERFPALANAPRQRGVQVGVSFKPLGTQIRNVRCMKCGVWGHSKGDRECQVSGWNPFASTSIAPRDAQAAVPEGANGKRRSSSANSKDDDSSDDDSRYHRKKRKKQRKRSYASDSDDDDDSYYRKKKHRSKKKKKKQRRSDREESPRKRRYRSHSPDSEK